MHLTPVGTASCMSPTSSSSATLRGHIRHCGARVSASRLPPGGQVVSHKKPPEGDRAHARSEDRRHTMRLKTTLFLATLVGNLFFSLNALGADAVLPSQVKVTAKEAKVMIGKKVLALVKEDDVLTVVTTNGDWLGVKFEKDGKEVKGWIRSADVVPFAEKSPADKQGVEATPGSDRDRSGALKDSQDDKEPVDEPASEVRILKGHAEAVSSVAFAKDGQQVISAGYDGTIRIWDVSTGKEMEQLSVGDIEGFDAMLDPSLLDRIQVTSVSLSPVDGTVAFGTEAANHWELAAGGTFWMALSDSPAFLGLWKVQEAEKMLLVLKGHGGPVNCVAFSSDGQRVVSGGSDNVIRLWDSATGEELNLFKGHGEAVSSVAFSPDGLQILSGSYDDTVRLWDVANGNELRSFEGHADYVLTVAFSPDGKRAVSAGNDKAIRLWNVATGRELRQFNGHTEAVSAITFSPDNARVLSGSADKSVRLWDVESGKELQRFVGHTNLVETVAFSPDGRFAISGSYDHTIRLWRLQDD